LEARNEFQSTNLEREAAAARDRYDTARYAGLALAGTAIVAGGVGLWTFLSGH
jgi:hypothetical protein